jgi:hypothetical protein
MDLLIAWVVLHGQVRDANHGSSHDPPSRDWDGGAGRIFATIEWMSF